MKLVSALAKVGGFTSLSRVLGFLRDLVFARLFGANEATDAFFVAFKLPNLFRRIFAEGAFAPDEDAMLGVAGRLIEVEDNLERQLVGMITDTPEAARDGLIGKIQDGDIITIDAASGELSVASDDIAQREVGRDEIDAHSYGIGRELFAAFRERASSAEEGASFFA